jgi:hypothetical protein
LPPSETTSRQRTGRNNRLRSSHYERRWATLLSLVWSTARRVERSGAGRYRKGDIEGTPPLHWSIKSGYHISWEAALREAADEIATRPELAGYLPAAGITVRHASGPLQEYVLMRGRDFVELLAEHSSLAAYDDNAEADRLVDEHSILVEGVLG